MLHPMGRTVTDQRADATARVANGVNDVRAGHADLTERTYRTLKELIVTREIPAGGKVTAEGLSQRFGVSRTTVKGAIDQLASEGLVEVRPQVGTFVRGLTAKDVRDAWDVRVMLEVTAKQARLERFDKKLPKSPELHAFINNITEVSNQAGLRNKWTVEPGVPIRSDLYAEWPISLEFEGDFKSVFNFLRRAEEMQRLTRVKGLKVRGLNGTKTGQVQVELSMNIYFAEG